MRRLKLWVLLLLVVFATPMVACKTINSIWMESTQVEESKETGETTEMTPSSEAIENTTKALETTPMDQVPTYVEGSIDVDPSNDYDLPYERHYRLCYYVIPGELFDFAPSQEAFDEFVNNHLGDPTIEPEEMHVVTFVKYFNVSKDEFIKAFESTKEYHASRLKDDGVDLSRLEETEIPNADIVYTFDNEIIQEYYRIR